MMFSYSEMVKVTEEATSSEWRLFPVKNKRKRVFSTLGQLIKDLRARSIVKTHIPQRKLKQLRTNEIKIKWGIYQEDSLKPLIFSLKLLIFSLVLAFLSTMMNETGSGNWTQEKLLHSHLLITDDLKQFFQSKAQLVCKKW